MALPTNYINLRSNYWVGLTRPNLELIILEVYVYTGTLTTDKPSTYQFRIPAKATNGVAEINISPFVRDYIEPTYDGNDVTNAVWVEYDLKYSDLEDTGLITHSSVQLTGLNGFQFPEEGNNAFHSDTILQSADYAIVKSGEDAKVPVMQDYLTGFELYENGTKIDETTGLTTTENTSNVIYYASSSTGSGTPDMMRLKFSGGKTDKDIQIRYREEYRHTALELAFVNRFGAIQRLWCFAKNNVRIDVQKTTVKRNLRSAQTYGTTRHQYKTIRVNGKSTLTVNTDFYPENANATFNELMLSDYVWIKVPKSYLDFDKFTEASEEADIVVPVNVSNNSLPFKTQVNDKLINYTFDLQFATDRISTIT